MPTCYHKQLVQFMSFWFSVNNFISLLQQIVLFSWVGSALFIWRKYFTWKDESSPLERPQKNTPDEDDVDVTILHVREKKYLPHQIQTSREKQEEQLQLTKWRCKVFPLSNNFPHSQNLAKLHKIVNTSIVSWKKKQNPWTHFSRWRPTVFHHEEKSNMEPNTNSHRHDL